MTSLADHEQLGAFLDVHLGSGAALDELKYCRESLAVRQKVEDRGPHRAYEGDGHDLQEAGWGIVISTKSDPRILEQLAPLLELRKAAAGKRFKEISFQEGTAPRAFLLNRDEPAGTPNFDKTPYYLLIAGGPDKIPFEVQYHLAVERAVGRIAFDQLEDYGKYARAVVKAETRGALMPRKMGIFDVGDVEEGDQRLAVMRDHFLDPLREDFSRIARSWEVETVQDEEATRGALLEMLTGESPAGCLVIGAHGARKGDLDEQRRHQGAPECRDGAFDADSIPSDLRRQLVLLFSCFGAGTPEFDSFPKLGQEKDAEFLTLKPFIAHLPKTLLSRGALAFMGHVDRGWTYSFAWEKKNGDELPAATGFFDAFKKLMKGDRLGHAFRPLNRKCQAIGTELAEMMMDEMLLETTPGRLRHRNLLWVAYNNVRNFITLGDPAIYPLGRSSGRRVYRSG